MAIQDILQLYNQNRLGANRRPITFDQPPIPDIGDDQYGGLFPSANDDIKNIRQRSVMSSPLDEYAKYVEETEASDKFKELLGKYPQHEDPSFMRKLTASLLGVKGGPKVSHDIIEEPHAHQIADWKNQVEPAYQAANLERFGNVNNRSLSAQMAATKLGQNRLEEVQRQTDIKAGEAQQRIEIAQDQQRLKWFAEQNGPDWEFDYTNPTVMSSNKKTGQTINTGVPTGHIDEMTKVTIQNQGKGRVPVQMQDPNNPGKTITAMWDPTTNTVVPSTLGTVGQMPQGPVNTPSVAPSSITPQGGAITQPGVASPGVGTAQIKPNDVVPTPETAGAVYKLSVQPPPPALAQIQSMTREVLTLLDTDVLDSSGKEPKLRSEIKPATGWSQWDPRQILPESDQRKANRAFGRLKDLLTLQLIGEMKAQSKTGATGFGQLTGRELDVLESAASKLDPALDDKTLLDEFVRIREKLQKILLPADGLNPTVVPNVTPETRGMNGAPPTLPPKYQQNPETGEMRVSYDGGRTWSKFVMKQ